MLLLAQIHNLLDTILPSLHGSLDDLYLGTARGQVFNLLQDHLVHDIELEFPDGLDEPQLVIVWNH